MEYDVQRALILLRDLERAVQGNGPAVKFDPPNAGVPCVHGDATRAGLLRLAVDLARAALLVGHSTPIRVSGDGRVGGAGVPAGGDGPAEVLRVELIDDPPVRARPSRGWWLEPACLLPCVLLATFAFAVIGFIHTVNRVVR